MPLLETRGAASVQGFGALAASARNYIEDVFSTYLYDGNGSTQTITNGIDLAGKGGMVWFKARSTIANHYLYDTVRGANKALYSNDVSAEVTTTTSMSFNSNGVSLTANGNFINNTSHIYTSWTFRKQAKFFDVVTYTGNGANRTISHNLGSVPGCIIVKRTDTTADWQVYHRSIANTEYLVLNTTAAKATGATRWNSTTATSTEFSLGTDTTVNASGGTYVAYLFAHNTAADGLIQCGLTDTGGNATLGWEPQWILAKIPTDGADNWKMLDVMRGWVNGSTDAYVFANSSQAELNNGGLGHPTATGFTLGGGQHIYIAIRRGPMKTPTTGTQVFQPTVYTGTNVDNRLVNTTIAPDMVWVRQRDSTAVAGMVVGDRLRGQPYLLTSSTATEVNTVDAFDQQLVSAVEYGTAFSAMNGFWCGNDATASLNANTTSNNQIAEAFKRAPSVFDVVCYAGTGSGSQTLSHNLTVAPEIIITKARNDAASWQVYWDQQRANLNTTGAFVATTYTASTATQFTVPSFSNTAHNYVAYLFATCPGVSKVFSYTGNGSSQTINCGFTGGARFVLIKRTDSTGDWYVWDSARGIVAGNDPHLSLNTTAAEVTTDDSVDTDSTGFVVNQLAATNVNVNTATYIGLAIA